MSFSGWVRDEASWLRRETFQRMTRRCHNWDYKGRGVYLITVTAAERGRGVWGRVETLPASGQAPTPSATPTPSAIPTLATATPGATPPERAVGASPQVAGAVRASPLAAKFTPNATGEIIARTWAELAANWPGVKLLASQVMEDHFHGVIATPSFMAKPLGAIIGSFKARASSAAGRALWAKGYVDTILFDDEAVEKGVRYTQDNPRRLAEKRAHPELFKVLRDLFIEGVGHFAAIGNHQLLDLPRIVQLQCSRSDFAYARDETGAIRRDRPPRLSTAAFATKCAELNDEIAHGAAVISPCISEGERELARRAFEMGSRVITLQNKGFSPLYKPGGRLFETCADGRLLMLAPIGWPYQPGEKPMTRADACTLNRIAQLIAGAGAAQINYRGMKVADVDRLVATACHFQSHFRT